MKKGVILKVISIAFVLITIFAIACAITGTGSGFLDAYSAKTEHSLRMSGALFR